MKKWQVQNKLRTQDQELRTEEVINILLANRGLKTKKEIEEFLHPKLEEVTVDSVGIDKKQLKIALDRIQKAIDNKEQIIVFGDYDVDGISGTAILWETLHSLGASVMPYIPHRMDEGYGLSIKGIDNVTSEITNISLIITVDNGIVANDAVAYANKKRIDVIITDHHTLSLEKPQAHAIVHTTKLCGTAVAWMLSKEIMHVIQNSFRDPKKILKQVQQDNKDESDHLGLVALATIADLVPLQGANRTVTKYGLERLQITMRPGILAICREAALDQKTIDTYAVGHIIGPRLNAAGRLEYAMDALRLICTKNPSRAQALAEQLGKTNKERQQLTMDAALHAKDYVKTNKLYEGKLLFVAHASYQQGVIGLIAGRLVEEFYRPAIVLSIGEIYSKASARSIAGFNIIEFIRTASEYLVDAGGHPMAAGFTVETAKLILLEEALQRKVQEMLLDEHLERILRIDCELLLSLISDNLYKAIQALSPFGMANQEPVFMSKDVIIVDKRVIGKDARHVKFQFRIQNSEFRIDAIGFGLAEKAAGLKIGDTIDITYTIDENIWNGNRTLQLKIKDFH